jgi:hypothetical protein
MSALKLALLIKTFGVRFAYHDGAIVVTNLDMLPPKLGLMARSRIGDILAVVAEQSIPSDVRPSDAVDAAREIVLTARRGVTHA